MRNRMSNNSLLPLQVFRYSALVAGLIYGVCHQSSLTQATKRAEIEHEYARKERLIEQAKAEWKKKTQPKQETSTQSSGRMLFPTIPLIRGYTLAFAIP